MPGPFLLTQQPVTWRFVKVMVQSLPTQALVSIVLEPIPLQLVQFLVPKNTKWSIQTKVPVVPNFLHLQ